MTAKKLTFLLVAIVGLGFCLFFYQKTNHQRPRIASSSFGGDVSWNFDFESKKWRVSGNPPDCPPSLELPAPVDIGLASSILYPGQFRREDFKPHGGFRFDNRTTNDVEVRAVMDGYILKASKYEDFGGQTQNFLFYVNDCGIMVMHDHLLTLSPKLQAVFDNIPLNKNGDSRTTLILPKVYVKKGEVLATEIGYEHFPGGYEGKNIFVDFGLYDLRKTNGIKMDGEYAPHALCWLEYLSASEEIIAKNLPAGGREGKESDYCK